MFVGELQYWPEDLREARLLLLSADFCASLMDIQGRKHGDWHQLAR